MAKRKTIPPIRKPQKETINRKAIRIAVIAFSALVVILAILIIATTN